MHFSYLLRCMAERKMASSKGCSLPLLLLFFGGVLGTCPDASLLQPCTCTDSPTHVTCANFSHSDDLQRVFDLTVDYPFPSLSLLDIGFQQLDSIWLRQKRVKTLVLERATLISLFEHGVIDPLPLVTNVTISNCMLLRRLEWTAFQPLVRLRYLRVSGTEVRKLGRKFRDNVSSDLEEVHLIDVNINSLEGGPFQGKTKLHAIVIRNGSIRRVEKSFFEDQKEILTSIDLSGNPIESLPDDLFSGFQQLIMVSLAGARLRTLSEQLFKAYHPILTAYDVHNNPILCDCNVRWVVDSRDSSVYVQGTCDAPPTLHSKPLDELDWTDFVACDDRRG